VSGQDPHAWALVNASPDVLRQLAAHPDLQPSRTRRDSALCAVVLCDGQVDHTTGLLLLRESTRPWPLYCTSNVLEDLSRGNPVVEVLKHFCGTVHHRIDPDVAFTVEALPQIIWRAVAVDGKPAPYSPNRLSPLKGDNVAFVLRENEGGSAFYAPGLAAIDEAVWQHMQAAEVVLVDGTFWTDDEMIGLGVSRKRAQELGHLPQSGPGGMLEWLARLPARTRKILIHINNTNPILNESSVEARELRDRGVEVASDGMEITL
jgi:pyrroloquinoline quinone biosynthesis protein B